MLYQVCLLAHVIVCVLLIGFVLLQNGKGSQAGALLSGGGNAASVFGGQGADSFLSRATTYLGGAFFGLSLLMAYLTTHPTSLSLPSTMVNQPVSPIEAPTDSAQVPSL